VATLPRRRVETPEAAFSAIGHDLLIEIIVDRERLGPATAAFAIVLD
jgi:hypothetical protein